jgi:hypothetical protein
MFYQSQTPVLTQAFVDTILAAFVTVPGGALVLTPKARLYNAGPTPSPQVIASAYTECLFSGYAATSITLSAPVSLSAQVEGVIANATFIATTGSPYVPDTALGYFITDATDTLIMVEAFPAPLAFSAPGGFLDLAVVFPIALYPPVA